MRKIVNIIRYLKDNPDLVKKGWYILQTRGYSAVWNKVKLLSYNYVNDSERLTYNGFGALHHNPFVSIIAVNYNGEKDLETFFGAILQQSYQNFELIIVDNDSRDGSENIILEYQKKFPKIRYVQSGKNLGFAAGNNYALSYCQGELLALVNVDTIADVDWLKELIDAISYDETVAAVTSKTLFFERFQDIEITSPDAFSLDIEKLLESLVYKKYFIREGKEVENCIHSIGNKVLLSLPIQEKLLDCTVRKQNHTKGFKITVKLGKNPIEVYTSDESVMQIKVDFSKSSVLNASYIINNAGSETIHNMPGDRGFGEYDVGQYDSKSYIDFFCGVSVLLRRSAIVNRTIFVSEFFAYYEDSELSRWLRGEGYNILYAPRSILYHQHSATSSEGSPLWQLLVQRSQKIYLYRDDVDRLKMELDEIEEKYKKEVPSSLYTELKSLSDKLINRLDKNNKLVENINAIGIYNSFWNTKGGGESHALSFAEVLQKYGIVYLISENDFDIKELELYYKMDLSNCRKIVQSVINTQLTEKFNIFINSTYRSNLISKAKVSYFIVSFPHKNVTKEFLDSYTFLYNSDYTKKWAEIYWDDISQSKVVYPVGTLVKQDLLQTKKEKIILNVGRFFVGSHCKNQLEIAKIFKKIVRRYDISDWKLVLIGSIDTNSDEALLYHDKIQDELKGLSYEIITNSKKDLLDTYYEKAYLYVHATGLGKDEEKHPDEFEHFGITPIEAMTFGCIPIVYSVGGAADLIQELEVGYTYKSKKELEDILIEEIKRYSQANRLTKEVLSSINKFLEKNKFENSIEWLLPITKKN
jgi:GT2 family glycosyltransferase/glycosyltransferase involved in cell wall biosynthesis